MKLRLLRYRLRKLRSLGMRELRDLMLAQVALLVAQVAVWTRPTGRLVRAGNRDPVASSPPAEALDEALRLSLAVQRAGEHGLFRPTCFVRSVALHRMLTLRGHQGSRIQIGIQAPTDGFLAHAWVEYGDLVLGDQPHHVQRFQPFGSVDVLKS